MRELTAPLPELSEGKLAWIANCCIGTGALLIFVWFLELMCCAEPPYRPDTRTSCPSPAKRFPAVPTAGAPSAAPAPPLPAASVTITVDAADPDKACLKITTTAGELDAPTAACQPSTNPPAPTAPTAASPPATHPNIDISALPPGDGAAALPPYVSAADAGADPDSPMYRFGQLGRTARTARDLI